MGLGREALEMSSKAANIQGVFRTVEPLGHAADGTPCFSLLRFYNDGLVLHTSLCKDVEAKWNEIDEWFNRDVAASDDYSGIGSGQYQIEGNHIRFSTIVYDRECNMWAEFNHSGEINGDRLQLRTTVADSPQVGEHEFEPLRAAQG
jgi:hypothetical protein